MKCSRECRNSSLSFFAEHRFDQTQSNLIWSDFLCTRVWTRWFQACFQPGLLHSSVIYKMLWVRQSNEIEDYPCIGKIRKCWSYECNHPKIFYLSKENNIFFRRKCIDNLHSKVQVTKCIFNRGFTKYQKSLSWGILNCRQNSIQTTMQNEIVFKVLQKPGEYNLFIVINFAMLFTPSFLITSSNVICSWSNYWPWVNIL